MRHLGTLRGKGVIESSGHSLGDATFELDGYLVHPTQIVASGEVHMDAAELSNAFGRTDLVLSTSKGLRLSIRFSGKMLAPKAVVAHIDVRDGLPPAKTWKR